MKRRFEVEVLAGGSQPEPTGKLCRTYLGEIAFTEEVDIFLAFARTTRFMVLPLSPLLLSASSGALPTHAATSRDPWISGS